MFAWKFEKHAKKTCAIVLGAVGLFRRSTSSCPLHMLVSSSISIRKYLRERAPDDLEESEGAGRIMRRRQRNSDSLKEIEYGFSACLSPAFKTE